MAYLEVLNELKEFAGKKELLYAILYRGFHEDLPEDIGKIFKGTIQDFIRRNKKELYKCNHCDCDEVTCSSHEIMENVFLAAIGNTESKNKFKLERLSNNFYLIHFK